MGLGVPSSLLCLAWFALLTGSVLAFEYSAYCTNMCMYGQGGNLCKCSAVHFAGKRMVVGGRSSAQVTKELDQEDMSGGLPQSLEAGSEGQVPESVVLQELQNGSHLTSGALASLFQKMAHERNVEGKDMSSSPNYRQPGVLSRVLQKYLQNKGSPSKRITSWGSSRVE